MYITCPHELEHVLSQSFFFSAGRLHCRWTETWSRPVPLPWDEGRWVADTTVCDHALSALQMRPLTNYLSCLRARMLVCKHGIVQWSSGLPLDALGYRHTHLHIKR